MAYYNFYFKGFNKKNNYNKYFIVLDENTYIFTLRWNNYSKSALMSISDFDDNEIISGISLVNGLKIRNNKLPYVLYFLQKEGNTYEPNLKNIEKEFALFYNDEEKP